VSKFNEQARKSSSYDKERTATGAGHEMRRVWSERRNRKAGVIKKQTREEKRIQGEGRGGREERKRGGRRRFEVQVEVEGRRRKTQGQGTSSAIHSWRRRWSA